MVVFFIRCNSRAAPRGDEFRAQFFADVGDGTSSRLDNELSFSSNKCSLKLRARDNFAAMPREKFHQRYSRAVSSAILFLKKTFRAPVSIFTSPSSRTFVVWLALRG